MKWMLQKGPQHFNSYPTETDEFDKQEPEKVLWIKSEEI